MWVTGLVAGMTGFMGGLTTGFMGGLATGFLVTTVVVVVVVVVVDPLTHLPPTRMSPRALGQVLQAEFARVTEWFSIRHCSAAAVNYLIAL